MTLFEKAKQNFNQVIKKINDTMSNPKVANAARWLLIGVSTIVAFSCMFGVLALAAQIFGFILLSAVVLEVLLPGSVTGKIKPTFNSITNKASEVATSVSNFFKKLFTAKPQKPDNKGQLETEPEKPTVCDAPAAPTESMLTRIWKAFPSRAMLFGYAEVRTGENLYKGGPIDVNDGRPVVGVVHELKSEKFSATASRIV